MNDRPMTFIIVGLAADLPLTLTLRSYGLYP